MDGPVDDRRTVTQTPAAPLPHEVEAWLRSLQAAQAEDSEDYPPNIRKRLLYVLNRASHSPGPSLSLETVETRRDGSLAGPGRPYHHQPHSSQTPRFIRPSDRAILRMFAVNGTGEGFAGTLRAIIATERGRWASWNGPVLHEAPPVPGGIAWSLEPDGSQRPRLDLPPPLVPLLIGAPWYADPATGAVGPVEAGLPDRIVRAMLSAPALAPAVAGRVAAELQRRAPQQPLPQPALLAPPERLEAPLQPHLRLLAAHLPPSPQEAYARANLASLGRQAMMGRISDEPVRVPLARLSWRYGGVDMPAEAPRDVMVRDGRLVQVVRDPVAEQLAATRLRSAWVPHPLLPDALPALQPSQRQRPAAAATPTPPPGSSVLVVRPA